MQSIGSAMLSSAFVAVLVAGGLSVSCVSNDDPDTEGKAGSGTSGGSAGAGTSGGSAGSAGSASGGGGTGGMAAPMPCPSAAEASGTSPVITNFESLTSPTGTYTFESAGLLGGTYIYSDDLATEEASKTERALSAGHDEESKQAIVAKIHNATWGGGVGFWFTCIDANVYTGITFWARGVSPVGPVKALLSLKAATKESEGGDCPEAGPCERPVKTFEPTDEWAQYTFKWADFMDGNAAGTAVAPSGTDLFGLEFSLPNDNTSRDLELALDDVAFTTD